jgi:hypothetical protein
VVGRLPWILLITALGAGTSATGGAQPVAQPSPPTLDQAVLISSNVDRSEVYLGEALTLTLEYWELSVRGLKVQPFYRGGGITLPALEGFYAGPLETEQDDGVRDGALYAITRYRQRLYPATAGDLEIGGWRWQGSVRGYTSGGARTQSVDLSTRALPVRVRPLPSPPSTFRGAVGEFEIDLSFSSTELTQGTPVALTLAVTGRGNPGTLEAPELPVSEWYTVGDPTEDPEPVPDPKTGQFTMQFHYDLMPLAPGSFNFPTVSFTYFSPATGQYQSARSAAVDVLVEPSGPPESLVVIGGGAGGGPPLMENGRLALAEGIPVWSLHREYPGVWPALMALPPVIALVVVLMNGGSRRLQALRWSRPRGTDVARQLAAVASHPEPVEALHGIVRAALTRDRGDDGAEMSAGELRAWMEGRGRAEAVWRVGAVLQACEDHRYGKRMLSSTALASLMQDLPEALNALEPETPGWRRHP